MDFIVKSWPGILEQSSQDHRSRMRDWFRRFQKRYAPSVVNNTLGTLRAIFAEAIERGARFNNPAAHLKRVKIRQRALTLPSRDQFLSLCRGNRIGRRTAIKRLRGLRPFPCFLGLRKTEAKFVTWADVDFVAAELTVRGDPATGTKNDEVRRVPMIPELRQLLESLRESRQPKTRTRQCCEFLKQKNPCVALPAL